VIEPEESAVTPARNLIDQARLEIADEVIKREFLQLIETILVYKLPNKSREEIEAMFGLSEVTSPTLIRSGYSVGFQDNPAIA